MKPFYLHICLFVTYSIHPLLINTLNIEFSFSSWPLEYGVVKFFIPNQIVLQLLQVFYFFVINRYLKKPQSNVFCKIIIITIYVSKVMLKIAFKCEVVWIKMKKRLFKLTYYIYFFYDLSRLTLPSG